MQLTLVRNDFKYNILKGFKPSTHRAYCASAHTAIRPMKMIVIMNLTFRSSLLKIFIFLHAILQGNKKAKKKTHTHKSTLKVFAQKSPIPRTSIPIIETPSHAHFRFFIESNRRTRKPFRANIIVRNKPRQTKTRRRSESVVLVFVFVCVLSVVSSFEE